MSIREEVIQLVNLLPERELEAAQRFLKFLLMERSKETPYLREYTRQEIREFLKADKIDPKTAHRVEQLLNP